MSLEFVDTVKFINVYVVRQVYSYTNGLFPGDKIMDVQGNINTRKYTDAQALGIPKSEPLKDIKICNPPFYPRMPDTLVEVYLSEADASQRGQDLFCEKDPFPYYSKISVKRHLALTTDNGKTVSLLDCINTFNVSVLDNLD